VDATPPSRPFLGLLGWLGLVGIAATLGALASTQAKAFYAQLLRPTWAPPGWIFGPVWSLLFLLMGLAAWRVWRESGFRAARLALSLFLLQLAANVLWSWLFFAWRRGALASLEILLLWGLILATLLAFRRVNRLAAWLLLPYLAWVTFATALCWATWRMNPQAL
jgi:benzodiazapine receptor